MDDWLEIVSSGYREAESVPCCANSSLTRAMSDNSNSTGSTGSSTNSWTLLSPEEAAVENVGPVDDGTESLGDVPSLSEELAGAAAEFKPGDIPAETVLSEEGHQVCQETSPESSEGPVPSSPSRLSPLPLNLLDPPDLDLESQPPVIHDIVTSSPSDNENQGAMPFVTNIDLGAQLDIPVVEIPSAEPEESCSAAVMTETSVEHALDPAADIGPIPAISAEPEVNVPTETLAATDAPSHVEADVSFVPEPSSLVPESLVTEQSSEESPAPETVGSAEAEEEEEAAVEEEPAKLSETEFQDEREEEEEEPSSSFDLGDSSSIDDGLRRRNVPSFEAPRPRTSDEEDEEEEVEFKLAEKKEDKPWLSMNKCIVGALVLLFLGSLFLSGFLSDVDKGPPVEIIFKCDYDDSELGDGEQSQDWLSGDPQDMKELLDKLTQENQQITQLEAQLKSQKEELDLALKAVAASGDEQGKADLEQENANLKLELSSLPELRKELETLRARVTELSQLTADQKILPDASSSASQPDDKDSQRNQKAAAPERKKDSNEGGKLKEELQRQKVLLEESKKRLDGMKKDGGDRKRVRDNLEEIQKKLSEQVERWGKKKPHESKWKGNKGKNDHWKKEEKKEWRGEKDWKHSKEGGWRDKEEKKEKEWKSQKQNSHKEAWRKHQDEWERKKDERKMDREQRRKEKPWHSKPGKTSHHQHQHHHHQPRQPHQYHNSDFWRDQEQKLQRNVRPQLGCTSVDECASKEGLYPVELSEFEELLEGYLSKLEGSSPESKDKIRKLTTEFFEDGVFIHDRVLFSDFAEDVADILEDMVDVLEDHGKKDDDSLEEEMEEFEREALWKFAATA
ncbi:pre-B-cell leukemia transcription factor-interacting protein 1 isoform X3 [Amphiprion ocellaris]|uniref:pre-B-cell leukemia transcription factor-interacting protein 1 isoform X3 n=1 Tax=Amphiprion ocellaris TaxID=80972 RepID=UPI0024114B2C|nr:pre-B-cell leukemia transcription factor-interacting protein 1 isoform X3 [Amphiprion ocellaris]